MRRIPIHTKLAAALAIPLLALMAVAVVEVVQSQAEARDVRRQAAVLKAATGPSGVFNALQDERNQGAAGLVGITSLLELPCPDNESCRRETDRSIERFRSQIEDQGAEVQQAYAPAFNQLDQIQELRDRVDAIPEPYGLFRIPEAEPIFAAYSEVVDGLLTANSTLALIIDDPDLRLGADLSYLASRNTDLIAHVVERLLVYSADGDGINGTQEIAVVSGYFHQSEKTYFDIQNMAEGDFAAARDKLVAESEAQGFRPIAQNAIDTGDLAILDLIDSVSIDRNTSLYGFRNDVKTIVEGKADGLVDDAEQRARMFLFLGLIAILIAVFAVWLVSRSITRPLRALTRQATDMANHRLPDAVLDILDTPLGDDVTVPGVEPVHVNTRDEVADVADALNTVQDSALDLAVEQAVLRRNIADSFVNLGRRNQNLLGRQLDFITELEHNETDPDTLANLFRLDHLATRMRRNAESLLVLAGIDPPRKWAAPVRITDAIRAALGEVEDYQRVTVRAVEPATILGSAAADLAHLLSELIENALIFSPPDQTVEIRGRAQPTGYTLAVIDSGLGMPPDELARANRRLAGAESFTIAPSKYLGHYVAGNLAARHNITVTLHNSPGHGITVTVNLPADLLTTQPPQPHPADAPTEVPTSLPSLRPSPLDAAPLAAAASGLADPGAPPPLAARTASGLAKRPPRTTGAPSTQPATTPSDDLLQTLANYTGQLQGQMPAAPALPPTQPTPVTPGGPGGPFGSRGGPHPGHAGGGTPFSPATGTPALSHLPPFPVTPPSGYQLPPMPEPDEPVRGSSGPVADPYGQLRSLPTAGRPYPSSPSGPTPMPPLPPLPSRSPQSTPAGWSSPPSGSGMVSGPPTGESPGLDGSPTSGGLARRIRGAQLPNTHMVNLRRGLDQPADTPAPAPAPQLTPAGGVPATPVERPLQTWSNQHSAKDVYSFLSDFTAGVRRGLDEADTESPDD